jgi:hypothetical protein
MLQMIIGANGHARNFRYQATAAATLVLFLLAEKQARTRVRSPHLYQCSEWSRCGVGGLLWAIRLETDKVVVQDWSNRLDLPLSMSFVVTRCRNVDVCSPADFETLNSPARTPCTRTHPSSLRSNLAFSNLTTITTASSLRLSPISSSGICRAQIRAGVAC